MSRASDTVSLASRAAVLPTDPLSGGTWLAVNDAGLALAVLNVNLPDRDRSAPKPPRSRGEVIPALLDCESPSPALGACERLNYREFAPFRLVLIGGGDYEQAERVDRFLLELAGGPDTAVVFLPTSHGSRQAATTPRTDTSISWRYGFRCLPSAMPFPNAMSQMAFLVCCSLSRIQPRWQRESRSCLRTRSDVSPWATQVARASRRRSVTTRRVLHRNI